VGASPSVPVYAAPARLDLGDGAHADVLGELGRGAQAVVYRVRHGGAEYALRVLHQTGEQDPAALRELHRQAALLAGLDVPGLPRVYAAGATGGHPYVLMDLIDGDPLALRLAGGPIGERAACAIGADVAAALAAAHGRNLVHRDVKPDNILLTASGAVLVDAGLADRADAGPAGDRIAGTPAYCPPEQTGMLNRPVDARSDLYALGAVLFACVTGAPPFAARDAGELIRLHATAPVPDPRALAPGLGDTFAAVVLRLLAKDPDDRYQSAAGLLADLRRLAADPDAVFALGADDAATVIDEVPFTGRVAELARMRARWDAARDGHGGIALLLGEPGSGKTRLVTELGTHGALVLRGRATSGDRQPLAPLRAAVDAFVRANPDAGPLLSAAAGPAAAVVKNLSPALAEVLAAPDVDGGIGPDRYASAVSGFLAGLARAGRPVLLHLDDAHWFDEGTTRVLALLAEEIADVPLLVVATARELPDGVPHDTVVTLPPLDAAGVRDLLDALGNGMRTALDSAEGIAALTGGNLFTALEYCRAILQAGLLRPFWGSWRADREGVRELRLPADSAQLLLRRTGRLDARARRVLGVAALAGSTFASGLLAEVTGADAAQIAEVLAVAGREGLVESRGDRHAFRHESIRTALLADFSDDDVRDLHDRIADALERRGAETDVYALAGHRAAGHPMRDPDRMLRAGSAAGARALAEHAPDTALGFLDHARGVAEAAGLPLSTGFRRMLGSAYHLNGRFADALRTLHDALDASTDRYERAELYHQLAGVHDRAWSGAEELRVVERGLTAMGRPLPRHPLLLVLSSVWLFVVGCLVRLTRLGYGTARGATRRRFRLQSGLYHLGASAGLRCLRPVRALLFAMRLMYPINRLGRSPERARDMVAITMPLRVAGLHRMSDRINAAATRLADELGDPVLSVYIEWMDAVAQHGSGHDQGDGMVRLIRERARWLDPGLALDAYAVLGWDWLLRGEVSVAEREFARRQRWIELGGHAERSAVVAIDAGLLALRGRAGEAAAAVARAVRNAGEIHEVVDALIARLFTALERDDLGASFDETVAEFDALGLTALDLLPAQHGYYVCLAHGRVAQARQDPARRPAAEAAVRQLRKVARRPIVAAHHRLLRAALAAPDRALRELAAAEPVFRRVDAPVIAFEAAVLRARALTALGVPGEAARQAAAAMALADAQGWPHRARRVAAEFGVQPPAAGRAVPAGRHGQAARWSALEQVSLAASRVLDPQRLTRIALDETVRLLGAERAFLFLMDPDTRILAPYAGRDAAGRDLQELSGYSTTVIDKVRHSREPLVVTGTEEGEALGAQSIVRYGLRSVLVAPLQLDERLLGVVYLDSRVAKGVFSVDDAELLTAVTHHIAVALETARAAQLEVAVATANRQRDLAETLRAAMERLSGTLDPAQVLRELLDTALVTPGAGHGRLLDAAEAARCVPGISAAADRLTVPLTDRDGPVGALVLVAGRPGAYTDADLGIAAALAGQAMVAYENARLFSRVTELATTDSLTGVANRRHFFARAEAELAGGAPGTVLMIDIDHFKRINDTYGHQAGDDVIRGVVARLRAAVPDGLLGRYGGEEFALLVTGAPDGRSLAESVRAAVAAEPVATRGGAAVGVTISIGVARLHGPGDTLESLLGRADAALYEAKQTGRDRVVAHGL
jgi:diguanylate cyclase (GGDEF)-like protein